MKPKTGIRAIVHTLCQFGIVTMGLTAIIAIYGCGEGGDSSSSVKKGVFFDSPVHGLSFITATQSGFTDANGKFKYKTGETIEFLVADLSLGQATARNRLSPLDLVEGAEDESNQAVVNICRLLQSLDADGNLNNGIQINEQTRNQIQGMQIEFDMDEDDFASDPDIQALFVTLNSLGVFTDGEDRELRTSEEALEHFQTALHDQNDNGDGEGEGVVLSINDRMIPGYGTNCFTFTTAAAGIYKAALTDTGSHLAWDIYLGDDHLYCCDKTTETADEINDVLLEANTIYEICVDEWDGIGSFYDLTVSFTDSEDEELNTYYPDADGDGYGTSGTTIQAASPPAGYAANQTDCDDTDADVNPGEAEVCDDDADNDCDGQIDGEGCSSGD